MSVKKTIVLFGSTGQGRSTIANMLIQGDIHEENNAFPITDSATGTSCDIVHGANEEFVVHDLVGLGGGGPTDLSMKKIKEYFGKAPTQIDYICFVKRKSRFTEEDTKAFEAFKSIFKEGERNFMIIVTHSKPDWVKANEKTIHDCLGEYPVVSVDFPHEAGEDYDRNKGIRDDSLLRLKDCLSKQNFDSITFKTHLPPSKADVIASQILGCIPLIGSTYKLLSAIAYFIVGNGEMARERIFDGGASITSDIINIGTLGAGTRVLDVIKTILAEKDKVEAALKKVTEVGNDALAIASTVMEKNKNGARVLAAVNTVKNKTEEVVNTLENSAKALDVFTKEAVKKDADAKKVFVN